MKKKLKVSQLCQSCILSFTTTQFINKLGPYQSNPGPIQRKLFFMGRIGWAESKSRFLNFEKPAYCMVFYVKQVKL